MRERPIIFNADMVRAVLDGRKTQTRRLVNPEPDSPQLLEARTAESGCVYAIHANRSNVHQGRFRWDCPFGQPGDRLWVRETFRVHSRATDLATLVYKASEQQSWTQQTHRVPIEKCNKPAVVDKWTPSIHMPRWASRITLEITGVRVERLRDLSEQDAESEGVMPPAGGVLPGWEHRINFRDLWMSIYGADNWEANPWVWVIEFKRVEVE